MKGALKMKDFNTNILDQTMNGAFTSNRRVSWRYNIYQDGDVVMWHETEIRCTGGWRSGPDVYARRVSKECFEAIENQFEFKRDPKYTDRVIVTDLSQDKIVAEFENNYQDKATVNVSPDGTLRLVEMVYNRISRIITVSSVDEAAEILSHQFGHWEYID